MCGHVTAIGDSVMLDAQPALQADIPGIDVEAAVSRQWDEGVALVQQMKAAGTLGSIVVIDLGTNGPVNPGAVRRDDVGAGRRLGGGVRHRPPTAVLQLVAIGQPDPRAGRADVPECETRRLQHAGGRRTPQWFGSDGVHMPIGGAGAQAMAALIASTI